MAIEAVLSHHTLFKVYPDLDRDFTYYHAKPDRRKSTIEVQCNNCKRPLKVVVPLEHNGSYVACHRTLEEEKACGFLQYITVGARA